MTIAAEQKRVILDTWFNLGAAGYSASSYPVYIGFTTANPTSRSSLVPHYQSPVYSNGGNPTPRPAVTTSRYDVQSNPDYLNPVWPHIRVNGNDRIYNWNTTSSITVQYAAVFKTESPNLSNYSQSDYDEDLLAYWRLMDPSTSPYQENSTFDLVLGPADPNLVNYNQLSDLAGAVTAEIFWKQ